LEIHVFDYETLLLGLNMAANGVRSFEEDKGDVVGVEVSGDDKTYKASSDDDDDA
jgi:hypothetical protein